MYLFNFIRLHILIWVYKRKLQKSLGLNLCTYYSILHIFLCEGGMHLLITGFASIGYRHGKARLGELLFEFEFVIVVFPDHTRLLF